MATVNIVFRKAIKDELSEISSIYKAAIGQEGCIWDEYYPNDEILSEDLEHENLYVLTLNEKIIGALAVVNENELDSLGFWKINNTQVKELARIVVDKQYQGNNYSEYMIKKIIPILKENECSAIHLIAAKINAPANKTYQNAQFSKRGECEMFENSYYAYELIL